MHPGALIVVLRCAHTTPRRGNGPYGGSMDETRSATSIRRLKDISQMVVLISTQKTPSRANLSGCATYSHTLRPQPRAGSRPTLAMEAKRGRLIGLPTS